MVTSVSAEAALEHYRGAWRLDVLTFAPAESLAADYLLFREPGSRQRGAMPRMAATMRCTGRYLPRRKNGGSVRGGRLLTVRLHTDWTMAG